jgi:hypothetical protein
LTRAVPVAAGGAGRLAARFDPARAGHIFREAAGHVNPASAGSLARFARLFEGVASNPANLRADAVQAGLITQHAADAGVQAFSWTGRTGQVWVTVRNGVIQNPECRRESPRSSPMTVDDALRADRAGDLKRAASHYEDLLAGGAAEPDTLLNLAVLYWQATDPGMAAAQKLPSEFLAKAGKRFPELIAEAERRFPGWTEPRFWRRYIAWADLGEAFDAAECLELLQEDPGSLLPAMHVFAVSQGNESEAEARELLRRCNAEGTTRSRYVASVIEGVMRRSARR